MVDAFLGEIRLFPFGLVPRDWKQCDGSELAISQNTALFAIIGNNYGTPSSSANFVLPNLNGTVPMGTGTAGSHTYKLGQKVGYESETLTSLQLPQHTHTLQRLGAADQTTKTAAPSPVSNLASVSGVTVTGQVEHIPNLEINVLPNTSFHPFAIGISGSGYAHENRQPYLAMNFCICARGIFPPRP